MKRTITKWIGIAAMAGAITFSLIQMRVPVVRADGCPSNPWPGQCSSCTFLYSTTVYYGPNEWQTRCVYSCACGGGSGGEFFEIEREYVY
jgi:hypothetical protein